MADEHEIQRIAAAMNVIRPKWPIKSLVTFLTNHHARRPYRDLLIAGVVVASDERTETPKLLNQHGPWWAAAQAAFVHVEVSHEKCAEPGHTSYPAHNCGACRAEDLEADTTTAPPTPDPGQAEVSTRGAALVREALRKGAS